ncbi:MAG: DUF397 domain-containing protein [Actinophytocola sp.]|nr:DUF397 domain-containing protein [Actinophytocola sp.]
MSEPRAQPVDDKADVRQKLDLTAATWQSHLPTGVDAGELTGTVEVAFVPHTDGRTYVAMRQGGQPAGPTLIFTPSEWEAFLAGAKDGEFDEPW